MGRFASADTIVPDSANPQALNRYSYALNRPLALVDPSGHNPFPMIDGVHGVGYQDPNYSLYSLYWRGMTEAELATYQGDQGTTNDCGAYASAAAINMLAGTDLDGAHVADLANLGWFIQATPTRLFPGQAMLPENQADLINWIDEIAADNSAPILRFSAEDTTGTVDQLLDLLGDPNSVVILTVRWANSGNRIPDDWEGHAMVLAAFDPMHVDAAGQVKPWGFVNSWGANSTLTWFTSGQLRDRWGGNLSFVESQSMVVVSTN